MVCEDTAQTNALALFSCALESETLSWRCKFAGQSDGEGLLDSIHCDAQKGLPKAQRGGLPQNQVIRPEMPHVQNLSRLLQPHFDSGRVKLFDGRVHG